MSVIAVGLRMLCRLAVAASQLILPVCRLKAHLTATNSRKPIFQHVQHSQFQRRYICVRETSYITRGQRKIHRNCPVVGGIRMVSLLFQ